MNNQRYYVELNGTGVWTTAYKNPTNWVTQEIIGKASSGLNNADGMVSLRWDGVECARGSKLVTRATTYPAYMSCNYVVHGVNANPQQWSPAWSYNNRIWADDVYVDTTWSRVLLGDSASYTACRKLEIQIPKTWSTSSITFISNPGAFAPGARVYLYVFDSNGSVNPTGAAINVGRSYNGFHISEAGDSGDISSPTSRKSSVFDPARGEKIDVLTAEGPTHASLSIVDIEGRPIKRLVDSDLGAGQVVTWDGRNDSGDTVASGVYIVIGEVNGQKHPPQKIVVIK
jgi:hypothetical protein